MRFPLLVALLGFVSVAVACGSEGSGASGQGGGTTDPPGGPNPPGTVAPPGTTTPPGSTGSLLTLGVWTVKGTDARGAFTGSAELRKAADGTSVQFARTVRYDTVKVEGGRDLHWAWTGTTQKLTADSMELAATLDPRGFIVQRGTLVRSVNDAVVAVTGKVARSTGGFTATYTAGPQVITETWTDPKPPGAAPLVVVDRTVTPANSPPSAAQKATFASTFASYQALPLVVPYKNRPEFAAGIFGNVIDRTDFEFYRKNPKALRVINRPVDDISVQETLARANAFGGTLEAKASGFDAEMEADFMEPGVWFAPDSRLDNGTLEPSGDGSLWTAVYIASQIWRFEVTGAPSAKVNAERSLDSLLKLQEIVADKTVFARTLRKSSGAATGGWHAGTGAFAGLDWLEGGNNDMLKGLLYGYTLGYPFFCEGADKAAHAALCDRIRVNAQHLADDVTVAKDLDAKWLAAVVTGSASRRIDAEKEWLTAKVETNSYAVEYSQGIADWSGTHLTFVGTLSEMLLANKIELGGDAKDVFGNFIVRSHENLRDQRLVVWHFLREAFGKTKAAASFTEDGRWRLREMPFPKPRHLVDHRIDPAFVMAPYPRVPWKNDWTTNDRTQSLVSYPLWEDRLDVMTWKNGLCYESYTTPVRYPGTDYLHMYWFARKFGLLKAGE